MLHNAGLNSLKPFRTYYFRQFLVLIAKFQDGPDLMEYNPTESIINWLNSSKGTRHIKGHICTGPRGPKAACR